MTRKRGGGPNQLIADRGAVHNNEENEIQTNNKQERITELKKSRQQLYDIPEIVVGEADIKRLIYSDLGQA